MTQDTRKTEQLTLEQVREMAAQGRHEDIEQARLDGRLEVLLSGRTTTPSKEN